MDQMNVQINNVVNQVTQINQKLITIDQSLILGRIATAKAANSAKSKPDHPLCEGNVINEYIYASIMMTTSISYDIY
jgi:hypothetical protein